MRKNLSDDSRSVEIGYVHGICWLVKPDTDGGHWAVTWDTHWDMCTAHTMTVKPYLRQGELSEAPRNETSNFYDTVTCRTICTQLYCQVTWRAASTCGTDRRFCNKQNTMRLLWWNLMFPSRGGKQLVLSWFLGGWGSCCNFLGNVLYRWIQIPIQSAITVFSRFLSLYLTIDVYQIKLNWWRRRVSSEQISRGLN